MQLGILATDGGPHPPDKWARMSAQMIVQHIVPTTVAVGEETHDVERSGHPAVVEFRKARDKFEAEIRDKLEEWHDEHQQHARAGGETLPDVEAHVKHIVEVAAAHHPALHAHLSSDEATKALAHRLQMDYASVSHIEHSYRRDGFTVDDNHRALKAG